VLHICPQTTPVPDQTSKRPSVASKARGSFVNLSAAPSSRQTIEPSRSLLSKPHQPFKPLLFSCLPWVFLTPQIIYLP
jgi:hypothetical protein